MQGDEMGLSQRQRAKLAAKQRGRRARQIAKTRETDARTSAAADSCSSAGGSPRLIVVRDTILYRHLASSAAGFVVVTDVCIGAVMPLPAAVSICIAVARCRTDDAAC